MNQPSTLDAVAREPAELARERELLASERLARMLGWCFGLGAAAAVLAVSAYVLKFGNHVSDGHEVWNQAGGFFGGIFGPTFSFLALLALLLTVLPQREQTSLARAQGAVASAAYAHQQFESTFFELLKLTRELQERFKTSGGLLTSEGPVFDGGQKVGAEALDSYAASIKSRVAKLDDVTTMARFLVGTYRKDFYNKNPSAFGPYFRVLYQTFKHIDESSLSDEVKRRYASIARGQISEGAVLLLALNGLTELGYNFIKYIERFGLLEHMHGNYRARFKAALLVGYHERAFMAAPNGAYTRWPSQSSARSFSSARSRSRLVPVACRPTPTLMSDRRTCRLPSQCASSSNCHCHDRRDSTRWRPDQQGCCPRWRAGSGHHGVKRRIQRVRPDDV